MNKYYFQILVEKTIIANDYETAKKIIEDKTLHWGEDKLFVLDKSNDKSLYKEKE